MIAPPKKSFPTSWGCFWFAPPQIRSENEPIEALESQIEMLDHTMLFHFCVTEKMPFFSHATYIDINEIPHETFGSCLRHWFTVNFAKVLDKNGIPDHRNLIGSDIATLDPRVERQPPNYNLKP